MSCDEELEYFTSSFRCIDPIQNFKIKVVLKSLKSRFISVPHFEFEKTPSTSESLALNEENEAEKEEYIFDWQEKVFKKSEISKYSDLSNCKTKLHQQYHKQVTKMLKNSNHNDKKLFTYVDADNYKPKNEDINPLLTKKNYKTTLANNMDIFEESGSSVRSIINVSKSKIVNFSPSDDFKNQNHLIRSKYQKMFIMADLTPEKSKDTKEGCSYEQEHILCVLIYDMTNGVLKMTPTFSKESNGRPYLVGANHQHQAHQYWLHHASPTISNEDALKEKEITHKILARQKELRKLQIGDEFERQPLNHIRVSIMGEIMSARDFDEDSVLLRYVINLRDGWQCRDPESLMGSTHTARYNTQGIAHIGHLFDVDLAFDLEQLEDFSSFQPEILFEVVSVSKWKIYRNEGYGYITLPRNPGVHNLSICCWRPTDDLIKSNLERFFIGGSQILDDVSCVGAKSSEKRLMSRFGLRTTPAGSIDVKLHIIHQCKGLGGEKPDKDRGTFSRVDTNTLLGNVNAVLEAFRNAREKMLKARDSLDVLVN